MSVNGDLKDFNFVFNEDDMAEVGAIMKRMFDGEEKNINPLKEIPDQKMRLYGFRGAFMKSIFCDTKKEPKKKLKGVNPLFGGSIQIFDYLGEVAGCKDVIRVTDMNGNSNLYVAVDEDGYGIYNEERSIYRGEYIWEYSYGSIEDIYSAFRERGIVFEHDIYTEIAERHSRLMDMLKSDSHPLLTKKKA